MEKKQSEVTYKIRSAIKKKLAEFSDFVDDELPDYIMILVANQRSKSQIEKDLSLFLRNDTINFTNWLWDLLDSSKGTKSMSPTTSKNEPTKRGIELDEDALILEFEPDEHETDFLSYEDTNDSTASKPSARPSIPQAKSKELAVTKPQKSEHAVKQKIRRSKSPEKLSKKGNQSYKEPLSSAVIPVNKRMNNNEDEYDPTKPEYKSPHKPTSRKCDGAIALQTNKLLLKAVDDATKSVLGGKRLEEFYKPTPIKVLTSKQLLSTVENLHREKKSMHKAAPELALNPDVSIASKFKGNEYESDDAYAYRNDQITESTSRTICLQNIPLISNVSEMKTVNYDVKNNYPYSFNDFEEARPKSPHFIVTLDGVSRATFKRKFEEDSVDGMEDDDTDNEDESSANEISSSPDKKIKLNERCRYWPACKNSDKCFYHHPTVACKCFPACKFGDKCLYIHPNCKFDALCSRKDCPFTHVSKRKLPLIAVPVKMEPIRSRRIKVVCKFYPNCASKNCPFIHPKLCRYGTNCRLPSCLYGHFPMPTRSQLKWHATLS